MVSSMVKNTRKVEGKRRRRAKMGGEKHDCSSFRSQFIDEGAVGFGGSDRLFKQCGSYTTHNTLQPHYKGPGALRVDRGDQC